MQCRAFILVLGLLAVGGMTGCGMHLAVESLPLPEAPERTFLPTLANAGADREILRGLTSRLDGTGTFSPSGATPSYRWEQIDGPMVFLSNPTHVSPTFVAPLDEAALTFLLSVDDGRYVTTDTVTLWVKNAPSLTAPRVRAGADRIAAYGSPLEPGPDDLVHVAPADATVRWEPVSQRLSRMAVSAPALAEASIYRVEAEANGLRSAPDYLVLWPFDSRTYGQVAPTCTLAAPLVVEPNATFMLDASACADANADPLQHRWVQLRGDPLLEDGHQGKSRITLTAPNRVQELAFRVYARDKALESAAAEVIVVVAASDVPPPSVAPHRELLSHAGNLVAIDATGAATHAAAGDDDDDAHGPEVLYSWTQTAGPPVETHSAERVLTFTAPPLAEEAAVQVAFAVVAQAGALVSDAAVVRVSVIDDAANTPPSIVLCTAATTLVPGQIVTLTALLTDAEHDPIASLTWASDAELSLTPAEAPADGCVMRPAQFTDDEVARWQSVQLTVPTGDVPLALELTACDALGACGKGQL